MQARTHTHTRACTRVHTCTHARIHTTFMLLGTQMNRQFFTKNTLVFHPTEKRIVIYITRPLCMPFCIYPQLTCPEQLQILMKYNLSLWLCLCVCACLAYVDEFALFGFSLSLVMHFKTLWTNLAQWQPGYSEVVPPAPQWEVHIGGHCLAAFQANHSNTCISSAW